MTKIKNCYKGKNLNNINVKNGQSYHNAVEEVSNSLTPEEDRPDDIFLNYVDIDDEEKDCNDGFIQCDNCTPDPDYIYCGDDLPTLGVRKGDTFEDVFEAINNALENPTPRDVNISVQNSAGTVLITATTDEDIILTFPNTTVEVRDQNGDIISTTNQPSGEVIEINVDIPVCEGGSIIISNSEQILAELNIPEGVTESYVVNDTVVEVFSENINIDVLTFPSGVPGIYNTPTTGVNIEIRDQLNNVLSQYINTIVVGTTLVEYVDIQGLDSTLTIRNSDDTYRLSDLTIPYGSQDEITIPDTDVTLKRTDNFPLRTISLPSATPSDITILDSKVEVYNSQGLIEEQDILAEQLVSVHIVDSEVVLENSVGTNLLTLSVPATTSSTITAPDANVNIYDQHDTLLDSGSVPSGGETNFVITIPESGGFTRMPFKTGQTISYVTGDDGAIQAGQDFFTLPIIGGNQQLNHFGNKWRFTGLTGGYYDMDSSQFKNVSGVVTTREIAFPDYVMLDNLTRDWNGDFLGFWLSPSWLGINNLTFDDANIYGASLSVSTFTSGWRLANQNELHNLRFLNKFDYYPFSIEAGSVYFQTSSIAGYPAFYILINQAYGTTELRERTSASALNFYALFSRTFNLSEF